MLLHNLTTGHPIVLQNETNETIGSSITAVRQYKESQKRVFFFFVEDQVTYLFRYLVR